MNYLDTIDNKTKAYFNILEPNFPNWLIEYINTEELLKQQYISTTCGIIYSNLFKYNYFYSSLNHSIAVALIIWHFTHDKKQTISGLFHDISTPVFKHCIDFLNGDYMNQESTEELTSKIISESKQIMTLLTRDNINLDKIDNYHQYPLADNDIPRLSADRLEYSLSNALLTYNLLNLNEIKEIYNDIEIQINENNILELGFKTKKTARKFVKTTSKLSLYYREDRTRYSMQLLADIIKKLNQERLIQKTDLYNLKEIDIINLIETTSYKDIYHIWKNSSKIKKSKTKPQDVYYVHHGAKIRYIDPLVKGNRISKICKLSKKIIEKNLSYDMSNYIYLDNINFNK